MGNTNGKQVVLNDEVNLKHFRLLRVVGKGSFGKVRIVQRKDDGLTFALKYIRKDDVVRSENVRNIIRERRMLEHLSHPFICNLRYSFQDVEYLYIVVDLMNGGDLRFHISRKIFSEEAVRFWMAELGCALRYIHSQGIVHRDIKPENVLLDLEGHVHLADFNVASDFKPNKPLKSKSGTLAYLAPEIYQGKGYSKDVDWWSLGVLFYECIYNRRPFESNDHHSLCQKIVEVDPAFPFTTPPVSSTCSYSIKCLLQKDPTKRIGAMSFASFVENTFFQAIDFEALENKEIAPIFIPSSDKTNFDATYDLEELLLEEAPLEARARRQKPREQLRVGATDQEIRTEELHKMIETLFKPYNYVAVSQERLKALNDCGDDCAITSGGALDTQRSFQPKRNEDNGNTSVQSSNTTVAGMPADKQTRTPAASSGQQLNMPHYFHTHSTDAANPMMETELTTLQKNDSARNTTIDVQTQTAVTGKSQLSTATSTTAASREVLREEKPAGKLRFFHWKKGRDRSPKAKLPNGVLAKGTRVIVKTRN